MSYHNNYDDCDDLVRNFRNIKISNSKQYDKNYFPKSKALRVYYNNGENRPDWVREDEDEGRDTYELIRIYSRNGKNKEYQRIVKPIRDSFECDIKIDRVYVVVNMYLERQYDLKKEQIEKRFGNCNEMKLYHATLPENVENICTHNFDWRLSGNSRGHKYGFGISFSKDPEFAHQFCKSKDEKVLVVSNVLSSSIHVGSPDLELPKDGYDTTCSPKKTVFVKFEDAEFLPTHVVHYYL